MDFKLKIWRQEQSSEKGKMTSYSVKDISPDMSFLEMLDQLNENLTLSGQSPVSFDSDCREGICGQCGLFINGRAHGPNAHTSTCQLHMRSFKDGDTIYIEPFRAAAFPIKKDLKIDRSALDKIIISGGFISVNTGQAPEANQTLISSDSVEAAFDAAACIGCGACVASCKNSSASLFTAAKISHLAQLPQGKIEHKSRTNQMVRKMDELGFGSCSNTGACEVECPQGISISHIAFMNKSYFK
ncbi:succinate dehydrogenase/fumarate reductase iron-sulfur subunit [Cyclobacterium sp. 1_MG-2023]|uniref:succinate dehydrogenase/fumarate reductase iron-sulfur subunit n=1 Tax=Cyclobacterium sp. 1_MG-2023 TaxID=3062681 RepID=UPI0026E3CA67|nr:succinate dehydrogenase/fumarate reductase iron-sulfur subunit [Cyclobacterium sp. 1_MG-2023]MDO6438235.1 succinate dehydrogenase/fumarate reductase iron-sulfur subunit [Cyclobacterium sp. 1_MG-2023]